MTGPIQAPITAGPYTTTSLGILAALSLTAAGIRALHKTLHRRRHPAACIACVRRRNLRRPAVATLDGQPLCAVHAADYLTGDIPNPPQAHQ